MMRSNIGRGIVAVCLLASALIPATVQAITLPIVPRSVLKDFFQTGDKPTAQQFGSLLDSMINFTDDRYLIGLKTYDPLTIYNAGDTVAAKRFGIGDTSPTSPVGYLDPHVYDIQLAPDFAGQWGFLPVLLGNSSGQSFYGYLQLWMDAPSSGAPGLAPVVEPPAIHVEYIVYNETPGQPFSMFAAPEPASAGLLFVAAACFCRRRRAA